MPNRISQLEQRIQTERRALRGSVVTLRRGVERRLVSPAGLGAGFAGGVLGGWLWAGRIRHAGDTQPDSSERRRNPLWQRLLPMLVTLGLRYLAPPDAGGAPPSAGTE